MRNKLIIIATVIVIMALVTLGYFSFLKRPSSTTQDVSEWRHQLLEMDWNSVDPTWRLFAEQHIEKMRQIEAKTPEAKLPGYKFDRVFVEIKSPFISKFLPNYQIYAEKYVIFAFNKTTKEITNIGNDWFGPLVDDPYYRNQKFSDFIKDQKIQVMDKKSAIDFLKLTWDIYDRSDTDNPIYWPHAAHKKGGIWIVKSKYIGPPKAMVRVPPVWEVVTDAQYFVTEVRQRQVRFFYY